MAEHRAIIRWDRASPDFAKGRYSREHTWSFDGGVTIPASPAPSVVPAPWSNAANVDPEEAFVAAVASCHMLTFLHLAANAGFSIARYEDDAVGRMTNDARGIPWVSTIELHPRIVYSGVERPTGPEEQRLHHEAHERCYIASSIKTAVRVVGQEVAGPASER
jgi:organic hydroperoxide reductase OsmC/OhrA